MDLNDRISRSSLHIEVADRVRDMIFDRSLPPGHRIDELDLSAKLGTSRTPLREALKVLANDGLVRLVPGRGAYVTELANQDVDALFPVLAMLEARCAGEAVRRSGPSSSSRLEAIHQRMEAHVAAGNYAAYLQAADDLHHELLVMAGNPWLLRAITDLRRFLRLARGMTRQTPGRLLQSLAEHRTLLKSISRGDADSAEQVMHHHLLAQQKAWRASLVLQAAAAAQNPPSAKESSAPETSFSEASFPDTSVPARIVQPNEAAPAAVAHAGAASAGSPTGLPAAVPAVSKRTRAQAHPEVEPIGV